MQGTRVFRGSALSRAIAANREGTDTPVAPPGPSPEQQNAPLLTPGAGDSVLDQTPGGRGTTVGGAGRGGGGAFDGHGAHK